MKLILFAAVAASVAAPALAASKVVASPARAVSDANQACRALEATAASETSRLSLKRLGDLPPGALQRAVLRRINGCPVLEVKLDGRYHYVPSVGDAQPRRNLGRTGK